MPWFNFVDLNKLVGMTFESVTESQMDGNDAILFTLADGAGSYALGHQQDCCENFYLNEIHGDLADLAGTPIVSVEESSDNMSESDESGTWTFYRFATIKGYVQIRFGGESNGYYSESANLYKIS